MKLISVVSPCFNEEENVEHCYEQVKAIFNEHLPDYQYEHIFVDNDSSDSTVEVLREISSKDSNIRVVVNARNYGPFRSTFNALRYAKGDAVLPMLPVDLQDPPELIPEMVRHWERGYLKVYGVRSDRDEGWIMRKVRNLYYLLVSKFSNIQIPRNTAEFQIVDRKVIQALLRFRDHYPYIRGMIANVGFNQRSIGIPYTWQARRRGFSKNRLTSLIDQGLNGLISFSGVPMRAAMFVGLVVAVLSIGYSFFQLALNVFFAYPSPPGTATIIVAVFFFAGVQLFILGVLGEYVSAIHTQLRHQDIVVEQELINIDVEAGEYE